MRHFTILPTSYIGEIIMPEKVRYWYTCEFLWIKSSVCVATFSYVSF